MHYQIKTSGMGMYRSLWPGERGLLASHLQRLSPADRRQRFLHAVSDGWLADYAADTSGERRIIGWFVSGILRGAADIHFHADSAEVGFTVDAWWRGRGVGRTLAEHALWATQNWGGRPMVMLTDPDNAPMLSIARRLGASLRQDEDLVSAAVSPEAAAI